MSGVSLNPSVFAEGAVSGGSHFHHAFADRDKSLGHAICLAETTDQRTENIGWPPTDEQICY